MRNRISHSIVKLGCYILSIPFLAAAPVYAVTLSPVDSVEQNFGENVSWRIAGNTLYISGSGKTSNGLLLPRGASVQPLSPYTLDSWQNLQWNEYASNIKELIIEEGITAIGAQAFGLLDHLETVRLPASVQTIESMAFAGCPHLQSVSLPEGTHPSIAGDAFEWNTSLYNSSKPFFLLNSALVEYGGESAEVYIPDDVQDIIHGVFKEHSEITAVSVPVSVTNIGDAAFKDCTNLKTVTFAGQDQTASAGNLQSIGSQAFSGCTSLENLSIPQSVVHVGTNAFQENPWLDAAGDYVIVGDGILYCFQGKQKMLSVPDSVKLIPGGDSIADAAISGDKIVEIQIPQSVKEIQPNAINCKNATIVSAEQSAAAAYALENKIAFRNITDSQPQRPDMTLDYTADGWYFGNSKSVFGDYYDLSDIDRQHLSNLGINTNYDKTWGGSCTGLAITVILAKNGVFSTSQLQAGTEALSEVEPTEDVVSFINYYQCIQDRGRTPESYEPDYLKFYRMLNIAKNIPCGESPFLLTFATQSGSHAVVGYGLESGEWVYNGKTYDGRILVWDSNYPKGLNDESCLYYDSQTFNYCIPHYEVHVAEGAADNTAGIITVCNDIDVLNAYPYPFNLHYQKGDLNCDGIFSVADVILLVKHLTVQTTLTDSQMQLADISDDEKVNAIDLTLLKRIMLSPAIT